MSQNPVEKLRQIPSVDKVLQRLEELESSHQSKVEAIRGVLDRVRNDIGQGQIPSLDEIVGQVRNALQQDFRRGLRRVVNATGVVLHTGLGRAVLPEEAASALSQQEGCCNLQIDLETGGRGRRDEEVERLLQQLTGAEAATVVNNNAAATLLVLAALCGGGEIVVSRGQLIEIGGSFRLPDVIAQSGATMVEVGTTNKTHLRDYETATCEQTAAYLRVNPSNYRIVGFSQVVPTAELVQIAKKHNVLVIDDLGCGALIDLSEIGLPREQTVQDSLAAGADVALFSGDKLIGGPQSGIIVGRKECLDRIRKHPLARAVRVGKLTIAALEATLRLFLDQQTLFEKNPTLRMLSVDIDSLRKKARGLAQRLSPYLTCEVAEAESACGGGALPLATLPTAVVALQHSSLSAGELARCLRLGDPSVISRVHEDRVLLDTRTLLEGDGARIEKAVKNLDKNSSANEHKWER